MYWNKWRQLQWIPVRRKIFKFKAIHPERNKLFDQRSKLIKTGIWVFSIQTERKICLQPDAKITFYRNRETGILPLFSQDNDLAYCNNITGLVKMKIPNCIPEDWRLFIDSSKRSLNVFFCTMAAALHQYFWLQSSIGCRALYNLPWRASVSSHQNQYNIPTFEALLRKYKYLFLERCRKSNNVWLRALMQSDCLYSSLFFEHYNCILFCDWVIELHSVRLIDGVSSHNAFAFCLDQTELGISALFRSSAVTSVTC